MLIDCIAKGDWKIEYIWFWSFRNLSKSGIMSFEEFIQINRFRNGLNVQVKWFARVSFKNSIFFSKIWLINKWMNELILDLRTRFFFRESTYSFSYVIHLYTYVNGKQRRTFSWALANIYVIIFFCAKSSNNNITHQSSSNISNLCTHVLKK